jgi:polar amino acid transport system substrate-binding protein
MKMNKKILALVAAGALTAAVGLFGCGSGGSQPAAEGSGDTSETSAAPVMTDAGYKLVKPGTLTVYTNAEFEPFEYLDGDEIVGFDVDLANAIGEKLGLQVEILNRNFDTIIPAVAGGKGCDVGIAGISSDDPERMKMVDFSDAYYTDDQAIAVMKGGTVTSENVDSELNKEGVRIAVQSGTTGETHIEEYFPNAEAVAYTMTTECFAAMQAGQVDAVCTNLAVVESNIEGTYSDAEIVKTVATGENYAIAISKDNPALTAAINEALAELKADGTIEQLLAKYEL